MTNSKFIGVGLRAITPAGLRLRQSRAYPYILDLRFSAQTHDSAGKPFWNHSKKIHIMCQISLNASASRLRGRM